jgi:lipoprotein-anchoring transpeptidase ErfK/SrfK
LWIFWKHGRTEAQTAALGAVSNPASPAKPAAVIPGKTNVPTASFNARPSIQRTQNALVLIPTTRVRSGSGSTTSTNTEAQGPELRERILRAQIGMVRQGISSGSLDGVNGSQTRAAIRAFQQKMNLPASGALDNTTFEALTGAATNTAELPPIYSEYSVTEADLASLQPVGETWLAKSKQTRLDYENILELVSEKSQSLPNLIRALNPAINWTNVTPGTAIKVPAVEFPSPTRAAYVKVHLADRYMEAFDANDNLLAHFPCSIGQKMEQRPAGELHVVVIAFNPNYTFDPEVFPESAEGRELGRKLILPPGPNNPVGLCWIGLDKPGYGMHGTPRPEQVGRTESHGCFRLANWNAQFLAKMAWVGMPVMVE